MRRLPLHNFLSESSERFRRGIILQAIGSIPDLILTADTVVVDANEILEKPQSADDNFRMIRQYGLWTPCVPALFNSRVFAI